MVEYGWHTLKKNMKAFLLWYLDAFLSTKYFYYGIMILKTIVCVLIVVVFAEGKDESKKYQFRLSCFD